MQRQRHGQRLLWSCVLGLSSLGLGALLPADLPGGVLTARAEEFTDWRFNPDTQQLEVVVPENSTPRYFLLAQPARIVLDLPNTDVGDVVSEQDYSGAVRRVRVAQFEPGVTRIVLELTPDTVLAPGQAELTEVETLPGGATRWTLRPLLAGDTVAEDAAEENVATAPAVEEPAIAAPPLEEPVAPVEPEVEEPAMVAPAPEPEATALPVEDEPAIVEPPEAAIAPEPPAPEPIPTLDPPAESATPAPEVVPTEPPSEEQPDPFAAEAFPNDEPVTSPLLTPDVAAPEPTDAPAPLGTEESPLVDEGADFLQTEPASLPLIQSSVGNGNMDEGGEEAIAFDSSVAIDPDDEENAIDIPIDFPEPTELADPEPEGADPESTGFPPASEEPTEAGNITVPPPDDVEPSPEPEEIAVAPTDPLLLIPSGTTLRLRYPGSTPIALEDDQVWQEVLVLAEPIQDEQGNVLLPAGSEILGRFEASRRGSRFIAQAIAIDEQIILFEAESDRVRGDDESPRTIAPNQIIELDVEEDVRRTAVGG